MRALDAVEKLKDAVPKLDPDLLARKLREYERGGLPSASMSDGRGGEPSLPLPERTDRQIDLARDNYKLHASTAALAVEAMRRIEIAWTQPLDTDSDKEKKLAGPKGSGICSNLTCDHTCSGLGNDRLRLGRCRPCHRVFTQTGKDRDARLETVTA